MKTPVPTLLTHIKDSKRAAALARACQTSVGYLKLIAYGHRRPGASLAKKIEQHSGIQRRQLRPDWYA